MILIKVLLRDNTRITICGTTLLRSDGPETISFVIDDPESASHPAQSYDLSNRLGLSDDQAAEQAGNILAILALITVITSPITGWLADRIGHVPAMMGGAVFSAASSFLLIWAHNTGQILLFGGLMSLGSAAFAGGSWAMLADLVPKDESARFFRLANFRTASSAAAAGLFGPLVDGVDRIAPGMEFSVLFASASLAFLASLLPLRDQQLKAVGEKYGNKRKILTNNSGLAVISLPADPASS
jgi:MFS family permease